MTTITCPECSAEFELDKAFEKNIQKTILAAEQAKHAQELIDQKEKLQTEATKKQEELISSAQKLVEEQLAFQMEKLEEDAKESKKQAKELQKQLIELTIELRESRKVANSAELEMQKKLASEEAKIREEEQKSAAEINRLKNAESEKKLDDSMKMIEELQRKIKQGSQQTQGEVLELDLETQLKLEYPIDQIDEVKKGERGADIKHWVKNTIGASCGLILWETKNAKWQKTWVAKFKQDVRDAKASIGIIVATELPEGIDYFKEIEPGIWVAQPKAAVLLASALRCSILEVDAANKMAEGKDAKMEVMYQYLTGGEFKRRMEAIVDSYEIMYKDIEVERKWFTKKWARQEKAIRGIMDNTGAMHGELQGMTDNALLEINGLELELDQNELN